MKNKSFRLLPIVFTAALLFTACSSKQPGADIGDSTALEMTITQTGEEASALPIQNSSVAAAAESMDDSALFSTRDLSGEYDTSEAVLITLNGSDASADSDAVQISGSTVTITAAGTYILSGTLENGSVIVNVSKQDKVQLVFNGASIHSDTFAALYVLQADKVFVTLAEATENSLTGGESFVLIDENDVDAVVYAKDDITFNGEGSLYISSPCGHGIVGKDEVTITGGVYEIAVADNGIRAKDSIAIFDGSFAITAGDDGLHAENVDDETLGSITITGGTYSIKASDDAIHATTLLRIDGGRLDITAAEGLEATYIQINDGEINISASDDGVNAAYKSAAYGPTVEINGGTLTVTMGPGDTDAVDSNGDLIVNGGTIDITAQSAFDCDGTVQYNGGTIIINGQTVNAIPNQMMGGGMGGPGGMNGGWPGR